MNNKGVEGGAGGGGGPGGDGDGEEGLWAREKYAAAVNSDFVWRAEHNAGLQEGETLLSCP